MAIRLRVVAGQLIAVCAARTVALPGDVYLDDAAHHALALKFAEDFNSEGLWPIPDDPAINVLRGVAESGNAGRAWWDSVYGTAADL